MPEFISGLQLNARFFDEAVRPLLARHFPDLVYSAALIGYGSDVLGFDDATSTDHNWGPRLQLFLRPQDRKDTAAAIDAMLTRELPRTFAGYSVHFGAPDDSDGGTQVMDATSDEHLRHLIEFYTVASFCRRYLSLEPDASLAPIDWLSLPEQKLLEVTAGAVFHDGLQELQPLRARLTYFPHDVWLFRMAGQWQQIAQEEAFVGRCGDLGDELGSRIVAARLVRHIMRLAFMLERSYAPYSKWLGSAFIRLKCAGELAPLCMRVLEAPLSGVRQEPLAAAFALLGRLHNQLGVTEAVAPTITSYFGRPYQVIFAGRYVEALRAAITDEELLAVFVPIGGVDQFVDSTDINSHAQRARLLNVIYGQETQAVGRLHRGSEA